MANGIVSISGGGSTCTVIAAPTFDKKRSKSSEKIGDEKTKRWVRSSSQEYDEVPSGNPQIGRCQSGGTSEAAEAAAHIAMQTLRKHYGDTIPHNESNIKTLKNSEYLNQTEKIQTLPISKPTTSNLSLTLSSTNFGATQQGKMGPPMGQHKPSSPSPPPPPPHRNVASPSKVVILVYPFINIYTREEFRNRI